MSNTFDCEANNTQNSEIRSSYGEHLAEIEEEERKEREEEILKKKDCSYIKVLDYQPPKTDICSVLNFLKKGLEKLL